MLFRKWCLSNSKYTSLERSEGMEEPIMWGGDDPFTHLLCVGPTRCGKSATILNPMMYQLLLQKKQGKNVGFSLIEPKGDLVRDVKEFCDEMDIPYVYIDPERPDETQHFNVMEGDIDDVAEATVAVLQSLFGKQEAFFQTVQELSTRNVTKLLKELKGNNLDLMDLLETLRDEKLLARRVKELKQINPNSELIPFFENELLGSLSDQYRKLVIGLRSQLENITSNMKLRKVITGKSDIDLDEHLRNGGILLVNTALGTLKTSGDAFGKFVIMHLQSATFRREGTEKTRTPHFIIADEFSRYINPDVEMFLSIAASYRVAGIYATQSLAQLEIESGKISGKAMKQAILTSCRNKIAFSGLSALDAQEFADEFGKDRVVMRQSTYKNRILLPRLFPDNYRDTETEEYRYHYTYLQDNMKRFHFLCRILKDGTPQRPFEGIGQFVPRDWKEKKEWEKGGEKIRRNVIDFPKKILRTMYRKKEEKENVQESSLQEQGSIAVMNEVKVDFEEELTIIEDEVLEFENISPEEKLSIDLTSIDEMEQVSLEENEETEVIQPQIEIVSEPAEVKFEAVEVKFKAVENKFEPVAKELEFKEANVPSRKESSNEPAPLETKRKEHKEQQQPIERVQEQRDKENVNQFNLKELNNADQFF